jgi:2-oxoglutarate dehydrogenase E2 component (dihydrolipoamide succinyltransferase)
MSNIRRRTSERLAHAWNTIPHVTQHDKADITALEALRMQYGPHAEKAGGKLTVTAIALKVEAGALRRFPQFNASIDTARGEIAFKKSIHVGVAVDTERGLLVPVIHNAGDLNLGGIAKRVADLAERTRANKITPDEIAGATFTLTNTGSRGALFDTPIVPSPQSAMLGTGAVVKRPVVVNDPELGEVIAVRSMIYLALSYDHRLIDGADAARFLTAIKERLEAGNFEAELGL